MQSLAVFMGDAGFLLPYIAFALFAILGVAVHRWRTRSWLLTEGRIEKLEDAFFPRVRRRQAQTYDKRDKGERFSVRIEYSFSLEGERYGGFAGLWGFDEKDFASFSQDFRESSALFVRYNVKNPDESELRISDNPRMQYYGVHTLMTDASPPDPGSLP